MSILISCSYSSSPSLALTLYLDKVSCGTKDYIIFTFMLLLFWSHSHGLKQRTWRFYKLIKGNGLNAFNGSVSAQISALDCIEKFFQDCAGTTKSPETFITVKDWWLKINWRWKTAKLQIDIWWRVFSLLPYLHLGIYKRALQMWQREQGKEKEVHLPLLMIKEKSIR